MSNTSAIGSLPGLLVILAVAACSHHENKEVSRAPLAPGPRVEQTDQATYPAIGSAAVAAYYKLYDPKDLKEVTDFNSLPPGIKHRYDPLGVWFSVGGLSSTSALVGSQTGDFVPYYTADAYVVVNNQWVKVKTWDELAIIGQAKKLAEWVEAVKIAEDYSTSKGLDVTLSRLNLVDPIVDLDKNIAIDKSFFIGLCEPPGHTPGVAAVDEPLVHTAAHGLWCLPGSGDAVTGDAYAELIKQARAYASIYNAELVRRIRSGAVN